MLVQHVDRPCYEILPASAYIRTHIPVSRHLTSIHAFYKNIIAINLGKRSIFCPVHSQTTLCLELNVRRCNILQSIVIRGHQNKEESELNTGIKISQHASMNKHPRGYAIPAQANMTYTCRRRHAWTHGTNQPRIIPGQTSSGNQFGIPRTIARGQIVSSRHNFMLLFAIFAQDIAIHILSYKLFKQVAGCALRWNLFLQLLWREHLVLPQTRPPTKNSMVPTCIIWSWYASCRHLIRRNMEAKCWACCTTTQLFVHWAMASSSVKTSHINLYTSASSAHVERANQHRSLFPEPEDVPTQSLKVLFDQKQHRTLWMNISHSPPKCNFEEPKVWFEMTYPKPDRINEQKEETTADMWISLVWKLVSYRGRTSRSGVSIKKIKFNYQGRILLIVHKTSYPHSGGANSPLGSKPTSNSLRTSPSARSAMLLVSRHRFARLICPRVLTQATARRSRRAGALMDYALRIYLVFASPARPLQTCFQPSATRTTCCWVGPSVVIPGKVGVNGTASFCVTWRI